MTRSIVNAAAAAVCALALSLAVVPPGTARSSAGAGAGARDCRDETIAPTVEQARLGRTLGADPVPVAERILAGSGLERIAGDFERALCSARSPAAARRVVDGFGRLLWERAVTVVQRGDHDDRPLYWARLSMALTLRQWRSDIAPDQRAALEKRLEYVSRGITSTRFARGTRKLLVSGFDPFDLDTEIRRGNPSGSAVLRLDGRVLQVAGRRVQVQAVVFPVRYPDFDAGMVEDAFRPHLVAGPQRADMFTTISQGRPGAFDLEVWNGRRRSTPAERGDNNNLWGGGTPTAPVVFPGVGPGAEFIRTTLPHDAMLAADQKPFPVRRNPSVTEIPAGESAPVTRPDGPTSGSVAVAGSGGGYLSNESAYRSTRLREAIGADLPGGHVHTPVLTMDPANATEITDPVFERNRADIGSQVEIILTEGLRAS
ncbi:MAG TPA: pyroglutamyl peptidase [Streptosporangiaceae bacterium]|nr:pyroglutamyl peptidase [Streptosporangiaceae bacterium]